MLSFHQIRVTTDPLTLLLQLADTYNGRSATLHNTPLYTDRGRGEIRRDVEVLLPGAERVRGYRTVHNLYAS